jgi:hypothetical protein
MSREPSENDGEVTTREGFHDALNRLLVRAHEGGVDVEGGWTCRNGAGHPDWDTTVVELEKERAE